MLHHQEHRSIEICKCYWSLPVLTVNYLHGSDNSSVNMNSFSTFKIVARARSCIPCRFGYVGPCPTLILLRLEVGVAKNYLLGEAEQRPAEIRMMSGCMSESIYDHLCKCKDLFNSDNICLMDWANIVLLAGAAMAEGSHGRCSGLYVP